MQIGTVVVGEAARRRLLTQPERTSTPQSAHGRGPADVKDELKLFPLSPSNRRQNVIRVMLGDRVLPRRRFPLSSSAN